MRTDASSPVAAECPPEGVANMPKVVKIFLVGAVALTAVFTLGAATPAAACDVASETCPELSITHDLLRGFRLSRLCDVGIRVFAASCGELLNVTQPPPRPAPSAPLPDAAGTCPDADLNPRPTGDVSPSLREDLKLRAEWAMVCLVNRERAHASAQDRVGRQPLIIDFTLARAARQHSEDIGEHNICGHTGSDGSDHVVRTNRAGYTGRVLAENVSFCCFTPARAVADLVTSMDHWNAMIDPEATEMGVGVALDGCAEGADDRFNVYTQLFGRRTAS